MGDFYLLVELHWEGSAPAACAAGLFLPYTHTVCVCVAPDWSGESEKCSAVQCSDQKEGAILCRCFLTGSQDNVEGVVQCSQELYWGK